MYDIHSLFVVDCGASGVYLKTSAIPYKEAEQRVVAVRPIGAGEIVV